MAKYRVALHAHVGAEVVVEADSPSEANRKAIEQAPKTGKVQHWTPVATSEIKQKEQG
jgi:hypothetical protein